jgi:hypothetical protein
MDWWPNIILDLEKISAPTVLATKIHFGSADIYAAMVE